LFSKDGKKILQLNESEGHFGWNDYEHNYAYTATVDSDVGTLFKISKTSLTFLFSNFKHLGDKLFFYRIPIGAHLFFKLFNLPNLNFEGNDFVTSFALEFYEPGELVVKKGDPADKFYMITSGTAEVTENDLILINRMGEGDYFGELGLLEDDPDDGTLRRMTKSGKAVFSEFVGSEKEV